MENLSYTIRQVESIVGHVVFSMLSRQLDNPKAVKTHIEVCNSHAGLNVSYVDTGEKLCSLEIVDGSVRSASGHDALAFEGHVYRLVKLRDCIMDGVSFRIKVEAPSYTHYITGESPGGEIGIRSILTDPANIEDGVVQTYRSLCWERNINPLKVTGRVKWDLLVAFLDGMDFDFTSETPKPLEPNLPVKKAGRPSDKPEWECITLPENWDDDVSREGIMEIIEEGSKDNNDHEFSILRYRNYLIFGGDTNNQFMQSGYMILEDGETQQHSFQELQEELEVYYRDGYGATNRIVCNERM